jgi:hypothetical protein
VFVQLNPPLPLDVIGKGPRLAIGVIDYGTEHSLIWVTAITATREIWCEPNENVRVQSNYTMGRTSVSQKQVRNLVELSKSNLEEWTRGIERNPIGSTE